MPKSKSKRNTKQKPAKKQKGLTANDRETGKNRLILIGVMVSLALVVMGKVLFFT